MIKPRRSRPPTPDRCKHLRAETRWTTNEGPWRIDLLHCMDCNQERLLWLYQLTPSHIMIGFNYNPVPL